MGFGSSLYMIAARHWVSTTHSLDWLLNTFHRSSSTSFTSLNCLGGSSGLLQAHLGTRIKPRCRRHVVLTRSVTHGWTCIVRGSWFKTASRMLAPYFGVASEDAVRMCFATNVDVWRTEPKFEMLGPLSLRGLSLMCPFYSSCAWLMLEALGVLELEVLPST